MTGDVDGLELCDQLVLSEAVTVFVGGMDERRRQVVGGLGSLRPHLLAQVGPHLVTGRQTGVAGRDVEDRIEAQCHHLHPVTELRAVLVGNAHQLTDHGHRHRIDEVADEVEGAARPVLLDHAVEKIVDMALDALGQVLDRALAERGGHEPADPGVLGFVEQRQRIGLTRHDVRSPLEFEDGLRSRRGVLDLRADRRVLEQATDVVEPGHDPTGQQLGVMDRIGAPQPWRTGRRATR